MKTFTLTIYESYEKSLENSKQRKKSVLLHIARKKIEIGECHVINLF